MHIVIQLLLTVVAFAIPMVLVPGITIAERRICARIQNRMGPIMAGPGGWLQPIADVIKMIFKEDYRPTGTDRWMYRLAPLLVFVPAILAFCVIPYGPGWTSTQGDAQPIVFSMQGADLPVGLLFLLAVSAIGAYGVTFGGWASNNKYSQMGGIRATAQLISYALTLDLALVAVVMISSDPAAPGGISGLRASDIVWSQVRGGNGEALTLLGFFPIGWNIFRAPLAFLLFVVAGFAETNRLPFDLPEAEPELVGGYHTEYSSLSFGTFMLSEYVAMLVMSSLIVTLFLGGWHVPGLPLTAEEGASGFGFALLGTAVFLMKVLLVVFVFIWVRWTLPRFRYDHLMRLGWKVFLPLALANIVLTALFTL